MRKEAMRVDVDGTVTYGVSVPRMYNKEGEEKYLVAASPKRARGRRFIPAGLPPGTKIDVTLPHDCANHLPDVDSTAGFSDHASVVFTNEDQAALHGAPE